MGARLKIEFVLWVLASMLTGSLSPAQQGFWQETNGPYGGDIRILAKTKTGRLLAVPGGTGHGLVYASTNEGEDWAITLENAYTYGLVVTKDGVIVIAGSVPHHISRSTDEGKTWTDIGPPWCGSYMSIAADDSGNVYAGGSSACGLDQGTGFVIKSTDMGYSWQSSSYSAYLFSPTVEGLVVPRVGTIFALGRGDAGYLFRSIDTGATWSYLSVFDTLSISCLAMDKEKHILVGTESAGIYRSVDDQGSFWRKITESNGFPRTSIVYSVFVMDSVTLFAGTSEGVLRSTNDGISWTEADSGLSYRSVSSFIEGLPGVLYAGTFGGGVFTSTNNGASWEQRTKGICRSEMTSVAEDAHGNLFAGTFDNGGIFKSTDKGSTWKTVNSGIPIANYGTDHRPGTYTTGFLVRSIVPYGGDTLFANATMFPSKVGIYRSTDQGEHWSVSLLAQTVAGVPQANMTIDPTNGEIFVWQLDIGYLHSTDYGTTWQDVGLQWDTLTAWYYEGRLYIADGDTFLFAGYDSLADTGRTMRSTDRGRNWAPARISGFHGSIGIVGSNPRTGFLYGLAWGESTVVFVRSSDHGASWFHVYSFHHGYDIRDLLVSEQGALLVDNSRDGLFQSTDDGETWTKQTDETVQLLAIGKDGYLYGSGTCSMMRSAQSILAVHANQERPLPASYNLRQNYPNPFNPSTIISYQIPRAGFVSLKVYNVLGQEVATLVNEEKQPGDYKARWDGTGMPSGVYFYTLSAGSYRETRKLLLLK